MMALGILTTGAVGIMALQSASTRGNMEAREMTNATLIAQTWIERLRRDSLGWTRSTQVVDPTLLTNTTYLDVVPAPGIAAPWFVPIPPVTSPDSASFNYQGMDELVPGRMHFCTNIRLEWLYVGRAMRADVRIWWMRRQSGPSADATRAQLSACGPGVGVNQLTTDRRIRMVYATTVLRWTPIPAP